MQNPEKLLIQAAADYYADPLTWVKFAYKWDQGDLEGFEGPDDWQTDFLSWVGEEVRRRGFNGRSPVEPIRRSTSSGHGIGKSALTAWLVGWILSTRPYAKGIVTANTSPQLESKTWAEIVKWNKRSRFGHWFIGLSGKGSMRLTHKDHPESWRCDAQTCREENSESFAGLHAANSTPFYIFDEASAVPNSIWEVAEGGLTDGEPMIFVFGNPTRNSGKFFETHNRQRHRWNPLRIDSRTAAMTNKQQIDEWIADYGEDSDFVRVRVKGEFPRAGSTQFISSELANEARRRQADVAPGTPRLLGVDVARYGDDQTVIARRHGRKAEELTKFRGLDLMQVAGRVAEIIDKERPEATFIDEVGIGAGVVDRLRMLGYQVIGVNSGSSPDEENKNKVFNKRAEMWYRMRDWIKDGDIPDDDELYADLTSTEYRFDNKSRIQLERKDEMKKRGLSSPDCADALALTFSYRTPPVSILPPDDLLPAYYEDF